MLVLAGHSGQKLFSYNRLTPVSGRGRNDDYADSDGGSRAFLPPNRTWEPLIISHRTVRHRGRVDSRARLHSYADSAMMTRSRKGRVSGGGAARGDTIVRNKSGVNGSPFRFRRRRRRRPAHLIPHVRVTNICFPTTTLKEGAVATEHGGGAEGDLTNKPLSHRIVHLINMIH